MPDEETLKHGKGVAFIKSRLKRLPQCDETWEADFQALPKPLMQTQAHYRGIFPNHKAIHIHNKHGSLAHVESYNKSCFQQRPCFAFE